MKIQLNEQAEIIFFDKNAELLTGYKKDEVLGENWFELFIDFNDYQEVMRVFKDLITGHIYKWEHTNSIKCKNGSKILQWDNNIIISDKKLILESIGVEII